MKIIGAVLEGTGLPRPFAESRPITISELDLGEPGPTEILVQLEAAGICHSDLSVVDGNRVRPTPMLLGHEAAGRVVGMGTGVTDLQTGQRVVMSFLPRCEDCDNCAEDGRLPCTTGSKTNGEGVLLHGSAHLSREGERVFHHLGVSGFATHAVVDRASVVPVDDDVPADIAAVLGCAVLTGGGAVLNAARPKPEDSIMIVGLGGVGMAALITAVSQNVSRIVAVDTLEEKLEHARRLGANETYTPQQVLEQHKGQVRHRMRRKPQGLRNRVCRNRGRWDDNHRRAAVARCPRPDPAHDHHGRSPDNRGQLPWVSRTVTRYPAVRPTMAGGRLPVEELITTRIRLADINLAMDQLAEGKAVRQVIIFNSESDGPAVPKAETCVS